MYDELPDDCRREHPRAPALVRVRYGSAGVLKTDFTENISQGGLFVATHEPFEIGQDISLRLSCPGLTEEVEVQGTVKWVGRRPGAEGHPVKGIGVQFDHLGDPLKTARLEALIDTAFEPMFPGEGPPANVLLVDPNPHSRVLYAQGLQRASAATGGAPIQVFEAGTGLEALHMSERHHFDVALVELGLPDMQGFDVIHQLTETQPELSICALSHGDPGDQPRALEAGAVVFAHKPVVMKALINTVKMMLKGEARRDAMAG
ncbi:MAG: response regulator [Bradymonadia bacterium]